MPRLEIASPENPTFKVFASLTTSKGIRRHQMALLSGFRQTREFLETFPDQCRGILLPRREKPGPVPGLVPDDLAPNIPRYVLEPPLFHKVDLFGTGPPILVLQVPPLPHFDPGAGEPGCTLCIPFQDPANVGTVIRTAAAMGVHRVVLLQEAAHPFHPRSLRAGGSNLFRIPLLRGPSLARLETGQLPLIVLSPKGTDAGAFRFPPHFCLAPGLEGPGIPSTLTSAVPLAIPMERGVESLNAAMATGMVLYLWKMGRGGFRGNSNIEIRKPKQIRISNVQMTKTTA